VSAFLFALKPRITNDIFLYCPQTYRTMREDLFNVEYIENNFIGLPLIQTLPLRVYQ
jgi:hypothetical protein